MHTWKLGTAYLVFWSYYTNSYLKRHERYGYSKKAVLRSRNFLFPLRLRLSKSFGSGSGAGSDLSFLFTFYHRFHFKKSIFHVFLWKNIYLIHMLDSIQYEFWFLFTTQADPEPEPKLSHSGSGSSQKFRLLEAPAPQHWKKVKITVA